MAVTYDVAIIGSGLAGSILGAVLARNGASVLMLDQKEHPKFAIGESTIPNTLISLRTMAARYRVPELTTLCSYQACQRRVGPWHGQKNHFGFLQHQEGKEQDPAQVLMYNFPKIVYPTAQFYRQDVDAYVFHAAVRYGCDTLQNARVAGLDFDGAGVTVGLESGAEYRARYLVDASGYRSPLAATFGLREEPCRFKHHSRAIWNHMIDVPDTDAVFARPAADSPPLPWYKGTVHHVFERGWYWLIPFDNDDASRNPLCSVGLSYDERRYPREEGATPEEEFWAQAERFPDVLRQFEGARPVREWVRTGRLQYSSSRTVGDRWVLLGHAAGFIDPLYSRGMSNTCETLNMVAWRLLRAIRDDDFSAERFAAVDRNQQALLDGNDELVNASFIAFEDYDLWTAVFRIRAWGSSAGTFRAHEAYRRWRRTGDEAHLLELEEAPHPGLQWKDHEGYAELVGDMIRRCDAFEAGETSGREAAAALYAHLQEAAHVPKHYGWDIPGQRFINPTPAVSAKSTWWAVRHGDPVVRRLLLGFGGEAVKEVFKGRRIF